MRRFFIALSLALGVLAALLVSPGTTFAQEDAGDASAIDPSANSAPLNVKNEYYTGTVQEIVEDSAIDVGGYHQPYQKVKVKIDNGPNAGRVFDHDFQLPPSDTEANKLKVGEKVVVVKVTRGDEEDFYVGEKYRLPSAYILFFGFFLLTVLLGRWKGFTSVLGLLFSLAVIVKFVLPQIVAGHSPVFISVIGGLVILFVSLYLAHGFVKRTTVALVSTLITLALSGLLAGFAVSFAKLFGLGSEEAVSLLQSQSAQLINLRGLLLGGIIIGALGVLDDITTAQSATVDEIHRANPKLSVSDLYHRGLSVGREHIASLVNTLALAYVGASLPVLLVFTKTDFPFWVMMNSEYVVEEVVRTLVGSMALMLAVPITTALAAYTFSKEKNPPPPDLEAEANGHFSHGHFH